MPQSMLNLPLIDCFTSFFATSSAETVETRPDMRLHSSGLFSFSLSSIGVSVSGGYARERPILYGSTSCRNASAKPRRANFDALYTVYPKMDACPAMLLTRQMRPLWRSFMPGSTARTTAMSPSTLVRTMDSIALAGMSSSSMGQVSPALQTRMSTFPETLCSSFAMTSSGSVMSMLRYSTSCVFDAAAPRMRRAAASNRVLFRATMVTCAPIAAKIRAVASPIPLLPPVTRTRFPERSSVMGLREWFLSNREINQASGSTQSKLSANTALMSRAAPIRAMRKGDSTREKASRIA
mmetsp:Transcript_12155/g.45104  ORF Transcript_12155/g.45104 Transcript_12155/m.45104 type:complete len:295 (-) Transcript_12155:123-1007(-)